MNSDNEDENNIEEEIIYAVLIEDEKIESLIEVVEEEVEIDSGAEESLLDFESDEVIVDSFQERRQQQFISQSRSKKQWTLITLGVLLAVIVISIGLLESPIYSVKQIEIASTNQDPIDRIERIRLEELTQKANGQPMYRNSFDDIASKIGKIASVSNVEIEKSWPSTLKITIVKRQPVGYIETDQGVALVDSKGFVFKKTEEALVGYPSFEGMDEIEFAKVIPDLTFVKVLAQAPSEIKDQIVLVKVENEKYSLELSDGIDIILGDNSKLKEKLVITWSILQAKKRSELGYIDVSVPSLPVSGSPQLKV